MAARIVALVVAVGMVVGAIALRARWDDDGGGEAGGRSGPLQLVCTPEVEAACQRIADETEGKVEVTVEPAGVTADRLVEANRSDVDGWLTPGPWPEIVDVLRPGRPRLFAGSRPLAYSAVALLMWRDRAARLSAHCGGAISWTCLGQVAGRPWTEARGETTWGPVKLGVPDPPTTASGLAVLGAGTAGVVGRTDVALVDLETPAYDAWLANLARSRVDIDLDRLLTQGRAAAAGLATVEAVAAATLAAAANRDQVRLIYPAPVATVGVVLASVPGPRGQRLEDLLDDHGPTALRRTGWTANAGGGLPPAGLLQALRGRWADVR